MGKTSIEWTDESSNPLRYRTPDGRTVWACVKVSPGCANCYSAGLSERFLQRQAGPYNLRVMQGLTPYLDEKEMRRLLTSKVLSGKRVFMCDMTDLFGEWVPDEMIAALFGVMAARPDVTFQVLTKHAERMARWFAWAATRPDVHPAAVCEALMMNQGVAGPVPGVWPLGNVHLGVSAEDQQRADERLDHLEPLARAGWPTWVSYEPALGAVDFSRWLTFLRWIVVGGESGHGARPFDLAWAASLSEQCRAAGVPCFFKQAGADPLPPDWLANHKNRPGSVHLKDRKGGDVAELARLFPDLAAAGVFRREWPRV